LIHQHSNLILAKLSNEITAALADSLEAIALDSGRTVQELGEPIERVYFPETAVLTAVQIMQDGAAAAVSMVGREGISGLEAVLHDRQAPDRTICQIPGIVLGVSPRELRERIRQNEALRNAILHYTGGYCAMLARLIACNRLHRVEQRCARWLLMIRDRIEAQTFPMTQEGLSNMLGAQRPTVTTTLAALREAGCLETSRGELRIADRKCLETYACECYWLCASYFELSTLGPS
jgi:CRP-like cAMP-binding protein